MAEAARAARLVTLNEVRANREVRAYIDGANEVMRAMGYTEHGHRHVGIVSGITRYIMEELESEPRDVELGTIAAYLHDIGNVINRINHPMTGANIARDLLARMGMGAEEIAPILGAIGNHEELAGVPTSLMGAAVIIADKGDVHRSRVQNPILESFDIHDRVNYAVDKSKVEMDKAAKVVTLVLDVDTSFATVMEYFEIFLSRMVMCRRAAKMFGYSFSLNINGTSLE